MHSSESSVILYQLSHYTVSGTQSSASKSKATQCHFIIHNKHTSSLLDWGNTSLYTIREPGLCILPIVLFQAYISWSYYGISSCIACLKHLCQTEMTLFKGTLWWTQDPTHSTACAKVCDVTTTL